jgi:hypothetical protein
MAMASLGTTGIASAHTPSKPSASNNLVLDSYEPNNDGFAGPVKSAVLQWGTKWVAEVQGTVSYYSPESWSPVLPKVLCGVPDWNGPMFPSPDRPSNKPVGMDAAFIFARPSSRAGCRWNPSPAHWPNFEISRGMGFDNRTVLGVPVSQPTLDHKYSYPIIGIGKAAQFRLKDRPRTSDNFGLLKITIRPATPADCANGGAGQFLYPDEASCAAQIAGPPGGAVY